MRKISMFLMTLVFLCGGIDASEHTKVNLKGTNKVKHFTLKIDSARTVVLRGVIQEEVVVPLKKQIIAFREQDAKLPIFVIINSPGGSILDGYEFITLIKSIPNPTYCIIESEAFSMAAVISQHCTYTYIQKYAGMMFHEASYGVEGSVSQISSRVVFMNNFIKELELDLAKQMGISYKDYERLILTEWWVTAIDAARFGLVDGLVDEIYYTAQPPGRQFSVYSTGNSGDVVRHPAR